MNPWPWPWQSFLCTQTRPEGPASSFSRIDFLASFSIFQRWTHKNRVWWCLMMSDGSGIKDFTIEHTRIEYFVRVSTSFYFHTTDGFHDYFHFGFIASHGIHCSPGFCTSDFLNSWATERAHGRKARGSSCCRWVFTVWNGAKPQNRPKWYLKGPALIWCNMM